MWSWLAISGAGLVSICGYKRNHRALNLSFRLLMQSLLFVLLLKESLYPLPAIWIAVGLLVAIFSDTWRHFHPKSRWCFCGFLITLLCYSKALWLQLDSQYAWWLLALLSSASVMTFLILLPQIDSVIFPAILVTVILVQMAWVAGLVYLQWPTPANLLGCLAVVLMNIASVAHAIHHYREPIQAPHVWMMGSYLSAHALFVASIIY